MGGFTVFVTRPVKGKTDFSPSSSVKSVTSVA